MKFRKKPVQIEAVQVRAGRGGTIVDFSEMPDWLRDALGRGSVVRRRITASICTLEGVMQAQVDDWIIRGVKGELYPCRPDIFVATYDPV